MKHLLRRLVDLASFDIIQKKLESWLDSYSYNTCDQNVERCLDVIELNSGMQSQLFELLRMSAAKGGRYGGSEALKKRLLPWLSHAGIFALSGVTAAGARAGAAAADAAALRALSDLAAKDRQLAETEDMYERTVQDLEADLRNAQAEADQLKAELEEKSDVVDALKRQMAASKVLTEAEMQQLRDRVRFLEDELLILQSKGDITSSHLYDSRRLQEEIVLRSPLTKLRTIEDLERARVRKSHPSDYTEQLRLEKLVNAFNDLSTFDRLDAEKVLRRYTNDNEQIHKIIFAVMQESFSVARVAFLDHKMRVRSTLCSIHSGPGSLESAVQDYIDRNPDSYDLPAMTSDVVRGLSRRPGLSLSPEASFIVIQPFVREACKLAWAMNALQHPLELAPAASLELYDSSKYRRSYDSDYDAGLVAYHIWPCLMQGHKVLVQGEAYTARASAASTRSRRSPTSSDSASKYNGSRSPYRTRSRSASPRRCGSSPNAEGGASCQSRTTSSSLSHYGIYS